ncbi:MAG: ATP-binding protein [Opitutales bacterium]
MIKATSRLLHRLSPCALFWAMWAIVFGGTTSALAIFYSHAVEHQKEGVRRDVLHLAQSMAHLVDVELHERLTDPAQMGSPEHLRALKPLVRFHLQIPEIHYVYTMRVLEDGREYFILDTAYDERVRAMRGDLIVSRIMEAYEKPYDVSPAHPAMLRGEAYVYELPYVDDFGEFISAQAPLFDARGSYVGYAGVDYDISDYRARVGHIRTAGGSALLVAFIASLVIAHLTRRMRLETLEEIAQRQAAERKILEAKERAEAATRSKSEMLTIASHDLKNPLTAIRGLVEFALLRTEEAKDPDDVRQRAEEERRMLETIRDAAAHMSSLIEELLHAERLSQPLLDENETEIDLSAELHDVLKLTALAAARKEIDLQADIAPGLRASCRGGRLREALENLLSNAVKYSPPGSTVKVALLEEAEAGGLYFSVQDEGPGIRPEERARLFGRFARLSAQPTGGESSTGLGLFIAKMIVDAHAGAIGCESEPGKGARFWIRLPPGDPS